MSRGKVRVGLVGVGNCASSFVQGIDYYRDASANEPVPGLMHVELGGYHVGDIEIACRLRRQCRKVGRDVRRRSSPRPTTRMRFASPTPTGVRVERGPTLDGLGTISARGDRGIAGARGRCRAGAEATAARRCSSPICPWARSRRRSSMPSGRSRPAAPSSTASRSSSPRIADGASASRSAACRSSATTSRARSAPPSCIACSTNLFRERGVRLDRTYQLNFGGNTDFLNMLERERLESKKISKTQAVTSQLDVPLDARRHPCRAERPRALAGRPQMVPHPHGGHDLRRRAAQPRTEARSVGFAQFRRRS